ncbi:MAG: GntR family transcriptional regulator [Afipia sp.]|nr:GntR family transcriptional regulator [Afipia sp.]
MPLTALILKSHPAPGTAPKASLVESAYVALKAAILSNTFPPGYQAAESDVASQLGMSRTPVHEAAIRLQAEGLVAVQPRKGILVCAISSSDIREIYELTIALEGMAAEVLALQTPSATKNKILGRLSAETRSMETALKTDDLDRWAAADDQFHRILTGECGNSRLARMAGTIRDQTHRTRLLTLRLRPKPLNAATEHRAIIEAIRTGHARAASENAAEHRRRASQIMIPLLKKLNPFEPPSVGLSPDKNRRSARK